MSSTQPINDAPVFDPVYCLNGELRQDPYPLPDAGEFAGEFLAAPTLEADAQRIIAAFGRFGWLTNPGFDVRIRYLWQKTGGQKSGANTLGWCAKVAGITNYLTQLDFVIGIAWDHATSYGYTQHQMEALLFHELCHVSFEISKKGELKRKLAGHDMEMFNDEVRHYGLWRDSLRATAQAFAQAPLFGEEPPTVTRPDRASATPLLTVHQGGRTVIDSPAPPAAPGGDDHGAGDQSRPRTKGGPQGEPLVWNEAGQCWYGAETGARFEGPLADLMKSSADAMRTRLG